jgi:hypothetical protein
VNGCPMGVAQTQLSQPLPSSRLATWVQSRGRTSWTFWFPLEATVRGKDLI